MTAAVTSPHLSHSQVTTFGACPRKWVYGHVEHAPKERTPVSLAFGIALHDALAAKNEAVLSGEAVQPDKVFMQRWSEFESDPIPLDMGKADGVELVEKGLALLQSYVPPLGIIGVEQEVVIHLTEDLPPIHGRIDLIRQEPDGTLVVVDLKSSATKTISDTETASAQLGLYGIAYPSAKSELIVLAKTAKPVISVQQVEPWSIKQLVRFYTEIHQAMSAGIRYAIRGWHCSSCQYRDRCRRDG